jgi:hypothetical protein
MDRGMASAVNIAWLQGGQRRYLIGASKSELKKFAGPLADRRDWRQVRDGGRSQGLRRPGRERDVPLDAFG